MIYLDNDKKSVLDEAADILASIVLEEDANDILADIVLENDDCVDCTIEAENDKQPEATGSNSKPNDDEGANINAESVVAKYAEEHFLEGLLDPMAKDITNKIIDMKVNNTCDIGSMVEVIESVNNSDFTDCTKDRMYRMVAEAYLASNVEYTSVLEFAGDPKKNKEFIQILELTEKYINDSIECTNALYKLGDKFIDIMSGIEKKNPDARKITNDCRLAVEDFNKWYNTNMKKEMEDGFNSFRKFDKLRKKFNNKYSTEIMESKKEIDKKLDELYTNVLNGEIRQWMQVEEGDKCEKWNRLVELWNKLHDEDIDEAGKCAKYAINPFVDSLGNQAVFTVRLIQYVRYYLDLEKENSVTYKIVQRVFKDKKKPGENDDLNDQFKLKTISMKL